MKYYELQVNVASDLTGEQVCQAIASGLAYMVEEGVEGLRLPNDEKGEIRCSVLDWDIDEEAYVEIASCGGGI